jgi:hypothetical protein
MRPTQPRHAAHIYAWHSLLRGISDSHAIFCGYRSCIIQLNAIFIDFVLKKVSMQHFVAEMSSTNAWNIDLENGQHVTENARSQELHDHSLPEYTSVDAKNGPLPCSCPGKPSHLLLSYGDRLVSNYLAPRRHPKFDNENYDDTIIQAKRFRHLNITRIQHDLLRLQHVLTRPGGGTEENFSRLSSLLHEHGMRLIHFATYLRSAVEN